ncbi:hypothetical protein EMCRGX_G001913 [Ephydatia muelleri]
MVPVLASEWELLGMYWRDKYYVETCLPFGLRSAPSIFDNFASALHWILEHNYGVTLLHCLDDFLLLGTGHAGRHGEVRRTSHLTFLGIELDSSLQQLRLLLTKLQDITSLTKSWLGKRSSTKRELLSLICILAFPAKIVPAGRLFLRRLIHLSTTVRRLHHRIRLNTDARADVSWWDRFLPSWNGVAMFIASDWRDADSVNLYTDASGSLGFGAYFNGAWIRGHWQPHQQPPARSIQWQELFAILAAAFTWGHLLSGQCIRFHCDNLPIIQAWASQSSKHSGIMCRLTDAYPVTKCHGSSPLPHRPTDASHLYLYCWQSSRRPPAAPHPAVAPSISSTYRAGTRRYIYFCQAYGLQSLPGSKHTIVAHLSSTLQANTIQVYVAAVSHLHLSQGFSSIQRSQAPAHLRPRRLPLTNTMLDTMFGLLDTDSLGTHDRLMLKAALSHGFFGQLRVCEFIITSRRALTQGHTPQGKTLPGPKAVSASSLNSPRLTRLAKEPQFQVHTTPSLPVVLCMMTLHGSSDSKYWSEEEEEERERTINPCPSSIPRQDYANLEMVDPVLASDTGSSQFTMSGPHASVSVSNALQARIWCTVTDVFLKVGKTSDALSCVRDAPWPHTSPRCCSATGVSCKPATTRRHLGNCIAAPWPLQPIHRPNVDCQLMYHSKRYDQAEKYLQEATAVYQLNHEAWYWLGEVFSSQGHKELAANCYWMALDLELTAPLQPFSVVLSSLVPSLL